MQKKYHYKHIALGGTFDHFHKGHEQFLVHAFSKAEKVSIGLSTDALWQEKFLTLTIESFEDRQKQLRQFLIRENLLSRAEIFALHDIFGIATTDKSVDALFATSETISNAHEINKKRKAQDLPKLPILITRFVHGNDNKIIRSKRIRMGEITRTGKSLKKIFSKKRLVLPVEYREQLRKPLGIVIEGKSDNLSYGTQKLITYLNTHNPILTIAIGDVIAQELRNFKRNANIEVIDFRTRRHKIEHSQVQDKNASNVPGTINPRAVSRIQNAIKNMVNTNKSQRVVISGEEDLLALPAILLAPLGSVVIYGQYDLGIVVTHVTEDKKQTVQEILSHFQ